MIKGNDISRHTLRILGGICLHVSICAAQPPSSSPEAVPYAAIEFDLPSEHFFSGPVPRSSEIINDATLNDVWSVGDHVWAVGERGVVVSSEDAGRTWDDRVLPFECSLKSVCFLTNRIGYVAGTVFEPFSRQHQGVIFKTVDGGEHWILAAGASGSTLVVDSQGRTRQGLPPVSWIRFFDLENAIAVVSHYAVDSRAEVLRTDDGGATWNVLACQTSDTRWSSGDFVSPNDGVVVGRGNSFGAVVNQEVVTLAEPQRTPQHIVAASIDLDRTGWLVGDGGFLLHSDDGGISWNPPETQLPVELTNVLDFRCVDQRQGRVCVAGSPGGRILSCESGGRNWNSARVESPVPLNGIRFIDDDTVIAVGAMGVIHRSSDGGQSWASVRNSDYRASVLVLADDPENLSVRMLASTSGNDGFRSIVVQTSPRQIAGRTDDRFSPGWGEALTQAGCSGLETDWMFIRNQPQHKLVRDELVSAWTQQTDGRVGQLLPARLARQIRIWRPDVICVESTGNDDRLTELILQALKPAMEIASGESPVRATSLLNSVGLTSWNVSRVCVRQPEGTRSPLTFATEGPLLNLGTTSGLVETFCRRQFIDADSELLADEPHSFSVWDGGQAVATPSALTAGLPSIPGTSYRRSVRPATADPAEFQRLVDRQQIEQSALIGQAQQTVAPLAVIASLTNVGRDLPSHLAYRQLQKLADLYANKQNLDAEIAILKEIVRRFPDLPQSADAAEKLFQYYSSRELRMLRRKDNYAAAGVPDEAFGRIPGIVMSGTTLNRRPQAGSGIQQVGGVLRSPMVRGGAGTTFGNSQGSAESAVDQRWNDNADAAWKTLNRLTPSRANSPRILLRQAANLSQDGPYGASRTVLGRATAGDGLYAFLALADMQGEHGLAETPIPILGAFPATEPPFLDAELTDVCWQSAKEIRLRSAGPTEFDTDADGLIMISWDEEYIYVAGRLEKSPHSVPIDHRIDRRHDAAHRTRDRLEFSFDVDRDYTTAFQFVIDETGQTSERCWSKRNWNPTWHVAADDDDLAWRFEVAIPHSELLSQPMAEGSLWATEIRRVVPGVMEQTIKSDEGASSMPAARGRGLIRFLRKPR